MNWRSVPSFASLRAKLGLGWQRFRARLARRTSEDGAPQRSRRRRVWPWVVALVVLLGAYPISVTAALSSGLLERMLRSEDLKVEIDNPAWTIWPGRIHLDGVRVYMNGDTQFTLSAQRVRATIQLLPLVKRRFFVSSLSAENVRYRMRLQVDDSELKSPRVAAFPPLEGLPGVQTKRKEKAKETEERESDWTVQLENIDVKVTDLWFMEYHYVGDGQLRGGFLRGPDILRVHSSVQDLGPGDLHFGEKQLIAKNFRGQVRAEIPKVNPKDHAHLGFFEFVEANISLDADVQTLKHVQAYLDGLRIENGAGPLQVRIGMADGALSPDSSIGFSTKDVRVMGEGFGVKSDWQLDVEVGADEPNRGQPSKGSTSKGSTKTLERSSKAAVHSAKPAQKPVLPWLRSQADVTYVSLARRASPPFTVQVHEHEQVASLDSATIGKMTKLHSARLRFPKIVTTDLDDLDTLSGKDSDLETGQGSARASLTLELDDTGSLRGPFSARLDDARFSTPMLRFGGNGRVKTDIQLNPATKSVVLSDIAVSLRDVQFRIGDERVEGWWIDLSGDRLRATGMPPRELSADLSILAKDAEPVLEGLAERDKIPDIVPKLTRLGDVKIRAEIRKRADVLDVMLDTLETDVIDFSGRVFVNDDQRLIALLIGGKTLSLGIFKQGDETDYEVSAGSRWLNEKLRHFPPPGERVRGQRP